jgi:hypothetical protein
MENNIINFCLKYNLTENQFYGTEKITGDLYLESLTSIPIGFNPVVGGYLDLRSLTSIPIGFNPFVGGNLYLRSLTSIPIGFNPVVGGNLDLESLTSIPIGFNPVVGGYLYLESLTSIPIGFNPVVGGYLYLRSLTSIPIGFNQSDYEGKNINKFEWDNGKYIKVDGIFSEVINKRGNVYKVKGINNDKITYIVTDGEKYSHGKTIKEAKEDLIYKISNRDKSKFNNLRLDSILSFKEAVECYRVITGSCGEGVKQFIKSKGLSTRKKYKISEIIKLTEGSYGSNDFKNYFK